MPRASLAQKKDFVTKAFCPRILALASDGVQDSCAANNFATFADLLAPFGQDVLTQITIQDGQGAPYFLDKINVRFVADFGIEKHQALGGSDVDSLVKACVAASAGADSADPPFIGSHGVAMEVAATDDISNWAPWYTLFRQQWVGDMHPSEHETFMHPVACLLVASGSEADPIGALRALQTNAAVQRVTACGDGGTKVLFYYVLLHDGRDTAALQTIDLQFDQVRKTFGQNSALLKINTNTDLSSAADAGERTKITSIWGSDISATRPLAKQSEQSYGDMLTMRDVTALRDAVRLMMVRSVVPHMQYVIRVLSDQTASERRGITGRLFSAGRRYLNTSSKAETTYVGADGETYYRHKSPEAMLRRLADCSFMLKDYRFAQSVYQIARRDFQSEKAWLCYAGAQEMVGVCKLLWEVQTTKAEFDSIFEDAVSTYLYKTRSARQFLAVRCIVVYYELLKHHRLYGFAHGALLRGPSFSASLAGLLHEQAAYSFLKAVPLPNVRKFAFYAMLASQSYQRAHMGGLASRCLRMVRVSLNSRPQEQVTTDVKSPTTRASFDEKAALSPQAADVGSSSISDGDVTAKTKWAAIDSYINHELGRQSMTAHNFDEAFQYFMALMGDEKTPAKLQSKYLQELLQLYLESSDQPTHDGKQASPIELSIPSIDPQLARIIMSPELEGEDAMLEWRLDGSSPSNVESGCGVQAPRCCSVGEVVAVLLVVSNPLTVGVTLSNFTLECSFVDGTPIGDLDADSSSALDVSVVPTVILEDEQTTMVTVQIVPRRAGSVSILGARYLLCDILPTFKSLVLPGRRMNDTKEQRVGVVHSPNTTLGFSVSSDLPRLEIAVDGLPDTLMSGSMHRACLRVTNSGTLACRSMALWVSHPSFVGIRPPRLCNSAEEDEEDAGMYVQSSDVKECERIQVPNVLRDYSAFVLVGGQANSLGSSSSDSASSAQYLEPLRCLEPTESFTAAIWIRGDRVGAHTLSLCIGASSVEAAAPRTDKGKQSDQEPAVVMRSRQFEVDLVVTPSLRVNAFVRPSARNPRERLVGVEVENMQADLSVRLVQTTFSSGFYVLTPVSNRSSNEPHRAEVGPRQSISLVYRARPYDTATEEPVQCNAPEMFAVHALRQLIYSREKPTQTPEPIGLVYSNHVFAEQGIDCTHPSLQSYVTRSQAHRRRNMLRTSYPLVPEKHHSAIFPLFESFGIDFVLFWSEVGGDAGRRGHHSISGIDLGVPHDYLVEGLNPPAEGAARTWLSDTMHDREALIQSIASRSNSALRSERPLDVLIRVGVVRLSDASGSAVDLYVADVTLSVYNHSWRHGYQFTLDLLSPHELGEFAAEGAKKIDCAGSRAAWTWLGETRHSSSVEPHGMAEVHAQLSCYAPGMIDVALWRLQASANVTPSLFSPKSVDCVLFPTQSHFVNVG
ncbi:hypothetical protein GGI20_004838 [Coemansia sp. BCRC 34301]|nr:hypothetical protein GGI20_004838 [Coemansia sp. BCRC 34301]